MKTRYNEQPAPVLVEYAKGCAHFTIAINITAVQDGELTAWEADTRAFWIPIGELNPNTVRANPAAYFTYVPQSEKQKAKDEAQRLVNAVRDGCPVVPVPSFREGAAVCHRPADDVKLIGGVLMGGLPYFELASGEVVELDAAALQGIMQDVAAWEVSVQQAKQGAWLKIDAATCAEDVAAALADLAAALS